MTRPTRTPALLLPALLVGCVLDHGQGPASTRPASFRVVLVEGDAGTPEDPLPFSAEGITLTFDVQALAPGGRPMEWDGWVRAHVAPGTLVAMNGGAAASVAMSGGRAEGVAVGIALAYGEVRVWFEDVGYDPVEPGSAACEDGEDQDGDGRFDWPDDPGCWAANDDSEENGRGGVGVSEGIHFSNPTLADVQGRGSRSPLEGASIIVDRGDLVVTRVAVDGLYVSDVDEGGGYGHLYLFNFSTPAHVRVCDRLSRLDGIVGEFFGFTELSFPAWQTMEWDEAEDCPVPEPVVLDAAQVTDASQMESLEAALVRIENVTVGTLLDCDENGDGTVNFEVDGECDVECECREGCDADPLCTERTQFQRYGQTAVALDAGAGPKLFVVAEGTVPDFDVEEHQGDSLRSVTGTLRHVEFLDPPWLVEPRCPDDLRIDEPAVPSTEACVHRRTEDEDEP